MKKFAILASLILTLTFSGNALGARAFIYVDQDPIYFGDTGIPVVWGANQDIESPWSRVDCYANETTLGWDGQPATGLVLAEYQYLGDDPRVFNDEFVDIGQTPSVMSGGLDCRIGLLKWRNGIFREVTHSEFEVLP